MGSGVMWVIPALTLQLVFFTCLPDFFQYFLHGYLIIVVVLEFNELYRNIKKYKL